MLCDRFHADGKTRKNIKPLPVVHTSVSLLDIFRTMMVDKPEKRILKFWCPFHGISTAGHVRKKGLQIKLGTYLLRQIY